MPTGSRRTIEVWPSRYSVTARPSVTRQAPAKNRNRSRARWSSRRSRRRIGLPVWLDSRRPSSSAFSSRMSAILSSARLRVWGVVRHHVSNAAVRRVDGPIHVRLARGRDVRDDGAVGRVLDRERLAGRRVDPLAADELLVRLDSVERLGHGSLQGHARGRRCPRCRMRPAIVRHSARPFQRGPSRATARTTARRGGRPLSGWSAPRFDQPDPGGRRADRADDGQLQLARQRLEVHAVPEPLGERVGGPLRVVAGPVEPAVDGALDTAAGPAGTGRTRRAWTSPPRASRHR